MADQHGGGFGTLMQSVSDRTLVGLLDRRRDRQKGIARYRYVQPAGLGVAEVQSMDGGPTFKVGAPRRTFVPGQVVLVASEAGVSALGQQIISEAPPQSGGASSYSVTSANDVQRHDVPPDAPAAAFLAFLFGSLTVSTYDAGGNWIANLYETEDVDSGGGTYLGDGTMVCGASGSRVLVDPIAQTLTPLGDLPDLGDAQESSGDILGADGRIYWVEFGPSTLALHTDGQTPTVTLRSCAIDGTDAQTVGSFSFDGDHPPTSGDALPQFGIWDGAGGRATPNSIIATAQWHDKGSEQTFQFEVRFALPGGSHAEESDAEPADIVGIPYSGGTFGTSATRAADALEAVVSDAWTDASGNALSIVGTNAMSYHYPSGVGYWGAIASFGGSTPHVVNFQPHPTIGEVPNVVFLIPES